MISYTSLFIGGQWVAPSTAATISVTSASTEEVIGVVPEGAPADADAAVAAARRAFDDPTGWASLEPSRRAETLEKLAAAIGESSEDIVRLVSEQNGMPISTARTVEGGFPGALLRLYAGMVRDQQLEEERPGMFGGHVVVRRQPVGVVAAIVPWNFPQTLLFSKLAPALAAGCTVVIKPSPETVLDVFRLAELLEQAGLPHGVVNIVPGGRELGAYLVEHPGVDKVAFTGSTPAGRSIAEACGRLLRPVTLELGGKSAAIVLDDAELVSSAQDLFGATLLNNGQTCFVGTRILAPRSRYDEVVDVFTAMAASAVVGDALDEATMVGPMASSTHRDRVEGYIAQGKSEGARLTTGGGRPERDRGWFVQPTIFADVDNSATIAREEIFGPVLSIIPYGDIDDAVHIANDSGYGLGGTVWSQDLEHAGAVARRVQTGTVGINHYIPDPAAPFGGVKGSGLGREFGPEGLANYQQQQSIYFPPV
ncbi:aldehyde dehydrogenase (plasmid) [Rhodococcus pseudokoreensis]|uniref:Aldehyde dehydrogenase n=1 Tax=Rhodococcus pseudokoreensis TaxID=2811421 RepID=A0A974VX55_9NOCA|nr:aldehyde dehydrogenase [Rhodococcus pseudokoreensis]QSE87405.1 aldehyde dehydrogenase [Rhodococcus pseudokoreensis]